MIDDMRMRKLAPTTQADYLRVVRQFAAFLGRPPDTTTVEDLRRYLLEGGWLFQGLDPVDPLSTRQLNAPSMLPHRPRRSHFGPRLALMRRPFIRANALCRGSRKRCWTKPRRHCRRFSGSPSGGLIGRTMPKSKALMARRA
jgi:hypothetical protein